MQDKGNKTVGFWPTFLIALAGLLMVMIVDGNAWGTSGGIKAAGLIFTILLSATYFIWRKRVSRAYLVRTGLEWTYGLTLLALFGSWILSADPRQGLSRIVWLLGYIILFYVLADALESGLNRDGVIAALLTTSGIVLLLAVLETYAVYLQWWNTVGSRQIMPPYPYRLISLVGHSNAMMGLSNLCAPIVLILFLREKKIIRRILLAFWLLIYLIAIPFSSSRGGMIGIAGWIGILVLFWLGQQKPVEKLRTIKSSKRAIFIAIGVVAIGTAGAAAYMAFLQFAQHPSHGTNIFGGRGEIWGNALEIWLENLLFGVGPGQFGFGYLKAAENVPPGFWALHAHGLPIQILAEFGIVGGAALLALLVENGRWFWKRFGMVEETNRWLGVAVMAGVVAWSVQMLVDDQTGVAIVMVSLILLLAYFVSLPDTPLRRWPQVNNEFLLLPASMLIIGTVWNLWAYFPLVKGLHVFEAGNCQEAIQYFEQSMGRDLNLSFYATQAGLAGGICGQQDADEALLVYAHQAFERSVAIEPDVSLVWANMAIIDWQTNRYEEKAIPNMQHALAISPNEPSYLLNLGWFYEQEDLQNQAVSVYMKVLEQKPNWIEHPFWQMSEVRQEAVSKIGVQPGEYEGYWVQAREKIETGEFREAELLLAQAGWVGEPALAVKVTQGMLAEAQGDRDAMITAYKDVANLVQRPALDSSHMFMMTYTVWLNRRQGITDDFVTGYLQLSNNYGQFSALERLYAAYYEYGDCEEASAVWQTWQGAIHGNALEEYSPIPSCSK